MKTCINLIIKVSLFFTLAASLFMSCTEEEVANSPKVATISATDITATSATMGGSIVSNGGAKIQAKGICYSTNPLPTIDGDTTNQGEGSEGFISHLNDLAPNTWYHARAYATNSEGTSYGEEFYFNTQSGFPEGVTLTISEISYNKASASISISSSGASEIIKTGLMYTTDINFVNNVTSWSSMSSALNVEHDLTGLPSATKYYIIAYAQNSQGTMNSTILEFTTENLPQVTDIDGNTYNTTLIGDKIWMAQNLKVTKFKNGDAIPTTANYNTNISAEVEPKYQWTYNDGTATDYSGYGKLYTSFVATDARGVCPTGWHMPSETEFADMITALGGPSGVGAKLKEAGTDHWTSANGTNTSNFSGIGSGMRFEVGTFNFINTYGEYWMSTEHDSDNLKTFILYNTSGNTDNYYRPKKNGLAIRCIKD